MNDGVIFYKSHFDNIKDLSDSELGQIFRACMTGETGAMSPHVKMAYNFVNSQIKRDKTKYETIVEKRRAAGRKGGLAKGKSTNNQDNEEIANQANANFAKQKQANQANESNNININSNNNINSNINNNTNNNKSTNVDINLVCTENATDVAENKESALQKRKSDFEHSLIPFLGTYTSEQLCEFADYWTEPNKSHTKMRYELERTWDTARRLAYWDRNSKPARHNGGSCYKSSFEATQEFFENQSKVIKL